MMNERKHEVGDYILGRTLGAGTTGKVKLAVHKETNKQVAIKIIKKSLFNTKPDLERKIHREVALMRLLEHPHLLKLFDVCESQHHLYIILEYASNGELFDFLIKRRFLPPEQALTFFREIIYGLEFLHSHGICHRDLKPENLLLDDFGHVKIADFGFARWMKSNIAETSCGSPHYAAPEVINGLPYDGRCADIWSCGVILYALLSGRLPFDDDSIRSLLNKVKTGQYKMPDFPDDIKDLISRMLTVDVSKRITIKEIKMHKAFLMNLPPDYVVPTPLPIPFLNAPIDRSAIDNVVIHILKSIGYSSEEEVIKELVSEGHTNAKVFFNMYNRNYSYDMLPWYNDEEKLTPSEQSMFIMPPRNFGVMGILGDPFSRRKQFGSIGSYNQTPQSLVQKAEWANLEPKILTDVEQMLVDIELPLEVLICFLQGQLNDHGIKWFHQNDMGLIGKNLETDMLVTMTASNESSDMLALSVVLVHGEKEEFDVLIDDIGKALSELLNNYDYN